MKKIENCDTGGPAGPAAAPMTAEGISVNRGAQQNKRRCKARPQTPATARRRPRQKGAAKRQPMVQPAAVGRSDGPGAHSKGATILQLISRPKGATLGEIVKITGWQAHSVRGFVSAAAKKYGYVIVSARSGTGDRIYEVQK